MSQLVIVQGPKPRTSAVSDKDAHNLRLQADKVLARHRGDLPQEIVTQLTSPMPGIVGMGLHDAASWIKQRTANLKLQYVQQHPDCEAAMALKTRVDNVLNGEFGDKVKKSLDMRGQRILELDLYQILSTDQLKSFAHFVKKAEAVEGRLQTEKARKAVPAQSLQMLFPSKEKRERKPKKVKPAYAGLPAVTVGEVDWDKQAAIRAADAAYKESRINAGVPPRGKAIHNPKNNNHGPKHKG